ncbi:uncharacterized protein PHALS_00689 [Plasmopara halstedii]|uniref:Uncharacterized protein n=1 Tax=Plasmopara halstedii TaxID=4781 RepID=A0A0P1ASS4_PLAHL|nr:uncharacterized protein PHALS_00689 [Plasmopara halstedii]CEG44320.1 hypothetical protein PHALS_00689 [Plasmopara halstedii]|eukprot:XP_024580689.1 hypothetical protein PHALS_00689 [Plasmopara halstedii]
MKTTYDHVIARNFYLNLLYKEQGVECLLSTNTGNLHFLMGGISINPPLEVNPTHLSIERWSTQDINTRCVLCAQQLGDRCHTVRSPTIRS